MEHGYETRGSLEVRAPFDFRQSLDFICGFQATRGDQQVDRDRMVKAVAVRGVPLVFELTAEGNVERPRLQYALYSREELTAELKEEALDRIRFYLSLDDDLLAFYALAKEDAPFWPVVRRLYGYRQVKFMTPFENTCWAVLVQRNPIPAARKLKQQLAERYGRSIAVHGAAYRTFPEPVDLAEADAGELRELAGDKRGDYLLAVADAFRQTPESFLQGGDYEAVKRWLLSIKGIGAWSAQFVLIRGLGRMNEIPPDDSNIARAASAVYRRGRLLRADEVRAIAAHYGNLQGYWAHYMRVGGTGGE